MLASVGLRKAQCRHLWHHVVGNDCRVRLAVGELLNLLEGLLSRERHIDVVKGVKVLNPEIGLFVVYQENPAFDACALLCCLALLRLECGVEVKL